MEIIAVIPTTPVVTPSPPPPSVVALPPPPPPAQCGVQCVSPSFCVQHTSLAAFLLHPFDITALAAHLRRGLGSLLNAQHICAAAVLGTDLMCLSCFCRPQCRLFVRDQLCCENEGSLTFMQTAEVNLLCTTPVALPLTCLGIGGPSNVSAAGIFNGAGMEYNYRFLVNWTEDSTYTGYVTVDVQSQRCCSSIHWTATNFENISSGCYCHEVAELQDRRERFI